MSGRYRLMRSDTEDVRFSKVGLLAPDESVLDDKYIGLCPHGALDVLIPELNALLDRAEKAEAMIAAYANDTQHQAEAIDWVRECTIQCVGCGSLADDCRLTNVGWRCNPCFLAMGPNTPEHAPSDMRRRAEKAEARVAELEAQVAAWSPARCYGEDDEVWDGCPKCGPSRVQRSDECYACGWASDPVPIQAKTAPKTPVPAPEPTETVQTAPPPSPAGAPRSDQGGEIETDTGNPGPGRIDPRGSESSLLDTPMPRPSRMPDGIVEAWQDGGRVFGTYSGGPRVELVPVPPDDGPVRTFVVAPQRALTAEEADAWTERLGKVGSTDTLTFGKVPAERPVYGYCGACKGLTPDPEIPFCAMCCDLGRGGATKQHLDHMREVIRRQQEGSNLQKSGYLQSSTRHRPHDFSKRPATTCEDVKCPCVELAENEALKAAMLAGRPRREPDVSAEVGLMGALQDRIHKEAGPYRAARSVRVGIPIQPQDAERAAATRESIEGFKDGLVRVLVDPAAAAEVEARTGEVALKKQAEVWRDAVLESIPKRRCEGCANGTALAAHSLCPACVAKSEAAAIVAYDATLRRWAEFFTPPRAGLPSRDEVAAFLEGRWPK